MNRRRFLTAGVAFGVSGWAMAQSPAAAAMSATGAASAEAFGVRPNAAGDQSRAFSAMLEQASSSDQPIFLPPGTYLVSGILLPRSTRLMGIEGATRLVPAGDGPIFRGDDIGALHLAGLTFDGAHRWFSGGANALLDLRGVEALDIASCAVVNSGRSGIALERASGRIRRTRIEHAADIGIFSVDAGTLDIAGNDVRHCANGGILVHRSAHGADGTRVTGNRIAHIRADQGGTGQFGNGINVYRAGDVSISGNHVSACAFSAIRSNGGSNLQVIGNQCLHSGETAIYSEFSFEGAVIANNIVDGAANGVSIVNFNEGGRLATCTGNLVRNLSKTGPYETGAPGFGTGITVEADCTATGNVIENAPTYGMHLGWGPFLRNVAATGNVIRRSGTGIAVSVVEGSGSAVISDNVISESERGAIVGYRWADAATGELANGSASGFAHLTVAGNQISEAPDTLSPE
ncbi:TIGR03808 family TAT-translocated repetitive protein [Nitratireductor luteus]|uniref:TIGR03808 family TAT-translocated repetitive protein n=1 Tax=Nitratireductor luteus TaxID=2976980 RepID=UPI00223ECD89|nr:TIGR03808 family TAT-translocated repetitive protein [Nitratireductor luteus]